MTWGCPEGKACSRRCSRASLFLSEVELLRRPELQVWPKSDLASHSEDLTLEGRGKDPFEALSWALPVTSIQTWHLPSHPDRPTVTWLTLSLVSTSSPDFRSEVAFSPTSAWSFGHKFHGSKLLKLQMWKSNIEAASRFEVLSCNRFPSASIAWSTNYLIHSHFQSQFRLQPLKVVKWSIT